MSNKITIDELDSIVQDEIDCHKEAIVTITKIFDDDQSQVLKQRLKALEWVGLLIKGEHNE